MRLGRIKENGCGYYHIVSRIVDRRHGRKGTLWEERFKSVLVGGGQQQVCPLSLTHHFALAVGHNINTLRRIAALLDIEFIEV